jgi:hypothetical protein
MSPLSFFICLLNFRIGSGNQGAGFAPTKAKGFENVLALPNTQGDSIPLPNEGS